MRKFILINVLALAAWHPGVRAQSQSPDSQDKGSGASQTLTAQPASGSIADAARKAREQKKEAKPRKVFTNDDLPKSGGISTVGASSTAPGDQNPTTESAPSAPKGEKEWRARFADLHHKLDEDQSALDVAQREANVDQVQFYGGDPQKSIRDQASQQPMGQDYNKKLAEIDDKKKQIADDQRAIDDAEDELRKSGGDPGWAR